jgi:hypothetical protein
VAVAVDEVLPVAEKVEDPHPLVVGDASVPNLNVGSTIFKVSVAVKTVSAVKVNATDVGEDVTPGVKSSMVLENATTRSYMLVDCTTDPLTALISDADANVTATVRVFKFAA